MSGFANKPVNLNQPTHHRVSGFINVDKPTDISTTEVMELIKGVLESPDVTHCGELDAKTSGCLVVGLGRATKLVDRLRTAKQEYVCSFRLKSTFYDVGEVVRVLGLLTGRVFQKDPDGVIGVRTVHDVELLQYFPNLGMGILKVKCDSGTRVTSLCDHLGKILRVGAEMVELRRVQSGVIGENDNPCALGVVMDALLAYKRNDHGSLKTVLQPLEGLLVNYKKIVLQNWAVHAVCKGNWVQPSYAVVIENGIEVGEEIVLITFEGRAVALAVALMTTADAYASCYGTVARTELVIMEDNTRNENE